MEVIKRETGLVPCTNHFQPLCWQDSTGMQQNSNAGRHRCTLPPGPVARKKVTSELEKKTASGGMQGDWHPSREYSGAPPFQRVLPAGREEKQLLLGLAGVSHGPC